MAGEENKWEEIGALFADLSKAFDCTDYSLLMIKVSWYEVTTKSINLYFSYLRNWLQNVRIIIDMVKTAKLCMVSCSLNVRMII